MDVRDLTHKIDVEGPKFTDAVYGDGEELWGLMFKGVPALVLDGSSTLKFDVVIRQYDEAGVSPGMVVLHRYETGKDGFVLLATRKGKITGMNPLKGDSKYTVLSCEEVE